MRTMGGMSSWIGVKSQVFIIVLSMLCCGVVMGDGFRNPYEGASVMGRGGVRTTDGTDASCAYHNPANLMDLEKACVMPSVVIAYSSRKFTAPNGMTEESEDPWIVLPAVFANWPLENTNFAAGLALTIPYGQASCWDENGMFRSMHYAQLRTANLNPSLAMRLSDDINIGAGVNAMWSDLEFRRYLPQFPGSRLVFQGDGTAFGGNAGITWKMTRDQRLALTYRSPMSVEYEGDLTMENPPGAPAGSTSSSDLKTEIDFPSVAVLGYSIRLTDALRVEANLEWVEHSRNQAMGIESSNPAVREMMGTDSIPQNWRDTWAYGVGADWAFSPNWTLRGGWYYFPTPVPDGTIQPLLAENDSNIFSIGLGMHKGAHAVDVAYAYNLMSDRTVDSQPPPEQGGINGTYSFDAQLCSISYVYSF